MGPGISLPDEAAAGKPVKVMLIPGPDGEQGGNNGVAVLYDSGVKFFATPSSADEALSDLREWQSADNGKRSQP
ncbi:MAG: hypothetical protein IBX62_06410 [Coriobacteriia bacterium]|nr:hypothetical protein [Coriobacteriia bacterium]